MHVLRLCPCFCAMYATCGLVVIYLATGLLFSLAGPAAAAVVCVSVSGESFPFVNNDDYSKTVSGNATHPSVGLVGINATGSVDVDIENHGDFDLNATGGSASGENVSAYAIGIHALGAVDNTGDIIVTASGGSASSETEDWSYADATGIYTQGSVNNTGDITATAIGGSAINTDTRAYGIQGSGGVNNTGDIIVTAIGGSASSGSAQPRAYGIYSSGNVNNTGNITVIAKGGEASGVIVYGRAYGIYLDGTSTLTSTGVIRAFGDEAYEVYLEDYSRVTLKDVYNMNLDGDPDTGSIYVGDNSVLDLNNALLSLTYEGDDFQWDTEYAIFEIGGNNSTVTGSFSGTSVKNPAVVAVYNKQGTEDSADDTVSLSYQPKTSPSLTGINHLITTISMAGNLVGQNMADHFFQPGLAQRDNRIARLYADSGTVMSDASEYIPGATRIVYLTPYYTNLNRDASPVGYDANTIGFVAGYELKYDDRLLGFHFGSTHTDLDFTGTGYSNNSEDQNLLTAGVHAMGSSKSWTWRGRVTGFYGMHDYEGLTGMNFELNEDADYNTWGINAQVMGGHVFQWGEHRLLPEVGFDYLWLSRESYTTDADEDTWDVHFSSLDEHMVFSVASLRWLTSSQVGRVLVTPSVAAGIRYLLTDDDIDVNLSVPGAGPMTVTSEQDDLAATLSGTVSFVQDDLSLEMTYAGEYSDEITAHTGLLRIALMF